MIEPHSAQLGASAWVAKATFTPPPNGAIPASPPPFPLPLVAWPLAEPFEAMTVRPSLPAPDVGVGAVTPAVGTSPPGRLGASSTRPDGAAGGGEARVADGPDAEPSTAGPLTASPCAVIPSSAFGLSAEAPNAAGASATTCDRSISPSAPRSAAGRNRL